MTALVRAIAGWDAMSAAEKQVALDEYLLHRIDKPINGRILRYLGLDYWMKLIVCGGRNFNDRDRVYHTLDYLHAVRAIGLLIEGGATGADSLAGLWATERTVPLCVVEAEWARFGKAAGMIRNRKMLRLIRRQHHDVVLAFPGGRGTAGMVRIALDAGIEVRYG